MSTRVLVILEDFRKDQYFLKPLTEALLHAAGLPNAQVRVCTDPLLGGVEPALDKGKLARILMAYCGMVDLFILIVDRDCNKSRRDRLHEREQWADQEHDCRLLAVDAWEEAEVWILAGLDDLPDAWSWAQIRGDCHPKEVYFDPLAERRGLLDTPGGGRKVLGERAARNYTRVCQLCPEDVGWLQARIQCCLGRGTVALGPVIPLP